MTQWSTSRIGPDICTHMQRNTHTPWCTHTHTMYMKDSDCTHPRFFNKDPEDASVFYIITKKIWTFPAIQFFCFAMWCNPLALSCLCMQLWSPIKVSLAQTHCCVYIKLNCTFELAELHGYSLLGCHCCTEIAHGTSRTPSEPWPSIILFNAHYQQMPHPWGRTSMTNPACLLPGGAYHW